MVDKQQDDTVKGRIIVLLQKGYNRSQLFSPKFPPILALPHSYGPVMILTT